MKYKTEKLEKLMFVNESQKVLKHFFALIIPSCLIVIVFFFVLENYKLRQQEELLIAEQLQSLAFYDDGISRDLGVLVSDLHVLANSNVLEELPFKPTQKQVRGLELRLLAFVKDRQIYDQIRYIDTEGNEVVRINHNQGNSLIVPQKALQNKSDRYYFKETLQLSKGETYLSPMDLNIENGQLEKPLKPVLRAATPIFDEQEELKGILIINYLAGKMLGHLKNIAVLSRAQLHLIDNDGFWFFHPDNNGLEWGALVGHNQSFFDQYPDTFQEINEIGSGLVRNEKGAFLFKKIYPLSITESVHAYLTVNDRITIVESRRPSDPWVIVIHIPKSKFLMELLHKGSFDIPILIVFIVLLASCCWMYAKQIIHSSNWKELTNLMFHSVDQGPSAVLITDNLGNIQYVNQAFSELTGYRAVEVIGKKPNMLKSGVFPEERYRELWTTISAGLVWEGEIYNRRKDGSEYWVEQRISPIYDLKGKITHFVGIQVDTTERHDLFEELNHIARHDRLTGLMNRYLLESKFVDDINVALRYDRNLSVLLIDIDYFKDVNDRYGHQAGDTTLVKVSQLLSSICREADYASRYGGEEFIVVLPETDIQDALLLAERARVGIFDKPITISESVTFNVSVSIGVSTIREHGETMENLIAYADKAMYEAKRDGRNNVKQAVKL